MGHPGPAPVKRAGVRIVTDLRGEATGALVTLGFNDELPG